MFSDRADLTHGWSQNARAVWSANARVPVTAYAATIESDFFRLFCQ